MILYLPINRLAVALTAFFLSLSTTLLPAYGAEPVTARVAMLPLGGTLDPVSLLPADSGGRDVVEALFAGLTRYDPASNQAQPALAREWTVSADGLTWTFKLRNDVQWVAFNAGSGKVEATRPLVAGDFLFALRRACDAEPPNPVAHTVYIVAGCRNIAQANPLLVNDVYIARELGVRAVNAQTLEIKLVFPAPYLPVLLALPEFRAVPREAISRDPDWTRPGLMLTSGPYTLAARDAQTLTLVRNPFWPLWEEGKTGNVERIVVAFSPSPEGLPGQFTAGNIDFARLDSITAGLLRQAKPDALLTAPGPTVTVLGFSVERTVIRVDTFRRALALALDRESLVRQALPGAALPTWRMTSPAAIGGPPGPVDNRGFAPEAAKAALRQSGFPTCRPTEKLDLLVEDRPQMAALGEAIIAQWGAVLGCPAATFNLRRVPLKAVQDVAHFNVNTSGNDDDPRPHMWLYSWTPDYLDASGWTGDGVHCRFGYMRSGVPCAEPDALVDAATLEKDPGRRAETYDRAETLWFGPAGSFPVAPLYVGINAVGRQPWLKGVAVNGPARFDLWTISR